MPELAADDVDRHALARELGRVGVSEPVRELASRSPLASRVGIGGTDVSAVIGLRNGVKATLIRAGSDGNAR